MKYCLVVDQFFAQLLQNNLARVLCEKTNNIVDVNKISLGVSVLLFVLVQVPTKTKYFSYDAGRLLSDCSLNAL